MPNLLSNPEGDVAITADQTAAANDTMTKIADNSSNDNHNVQQTREREWLE